VSPGFLLDADLCIELLRGRTPARLRTWIAEQGAALAMSAVVLSELRFGAERSSAPALHHRGVDALTGLVPVMPLDADAARHAGSIRAALAARGTPVGLADALIAGHARSLAATLVTGNVREFRRVPGLLLEDWRALA